MAAGARSCAASSSAFLAVCLLALASSSFLCASSLACLAVGLSALSLMAAGARSCAASSSALAFGLPVFGSRWLALAFCAVLFGLASLVLPFDSSCRSRRLVLVSRRPRLYVDFPVGPNYMLLPIAKSSLPLLQCRSSPRSSFGFLFYLWNVFVAGFSFPWTLSLL